MRLAALFLDDRRHPASKGVKVGTAVVVALLLSLLSWTVFASSVDSTQKFWSYRIAFWNGWLLTLGISLVSLLLSTAIGVAAALARRSKIIIIRYVSIIYVEMVRGLPYLVLILLLFYGMPHITAWGNRFLFGVVALSLFAGAYIAEIVRSGIESVGASQLESARAIGLTPAQTYLHVIFPQALRHALPPLTGQFASLIKDSSLLSVIGLAEFTFTAQQVFSATYSTMGSFLPLGVGYLLLTLPISLWSKKLEQSLKYET